MNAIDFSSVRTKLNHELENASPLMRVLTICIWGLGGIVGSLWALFWVAALIIGALDLIQQFGQNAAWVLVWLPFTVLCLLLARRFFRAAK